LGFLGCVAKSLLVLAGACCGFAFVSFASMGNTEIALLFLAAIMIPGSMIVYEYLKPQEKAKNGTAKETSSMLTLLRSLN